MRFQQSALALTLIMVGLLLSGCGKKQDEPPADAGAQDTGVQDSGAQDAGAQVANTPAQPALLPIRVATTDQPINLPSPATGLAFWEHPFLPYEGMVIAATRNGLFAHTLEGPEAVDIVSDIEASGGAIAYFAEPPASDGAAVAAQGVFVTFDTANSAYRFFRIDNATRSLNEDLISLPVRPQIDNPIDFCLIPGASDDATLSLQLISLEAGTVAVYTYRQNAAAQWSVKTERYPTRLAAAACAHDQHSEQTWLIDRSGEIYIFNPQNGDATATISTGIANPGGISLHRSRQSREDGTPFVRTQMLVLNAANGEVQMIDLATNLPNGLLQFAEFDVINGVVEASAIDVASGNFGGLYRVGAIALGAIEKDADNATITAVRLTPFIAVANALDFEIDAIVSDRAVNVQEAKTVDPARPDITIDLDALTP